MRGINFFFLIIIYKSLFSQHSFTTIPSGNYIIGSEINLMNFKRTVSVETFKISIYEITNKQFKEFIDSTGYVTTAEINKDAMVFRWGLKEFFWFKDSTANWKFPNGVAYGSIDSIMNHPVTTISYKDAVEFCKWNNTRLPTIIEWEVASKGNVDSKYFFGNNNSLIHNFANVWEGRTHNSDFTNDNFLFTSPVGLFQPNQHGIFDIYGNVFEFCEGNIPNLDTLNDNIIHTRGGSWWCSQGSCDAFNSWNIGSLNSTASFSNVGFRVCE
jgi:sulfatase modifying factor 1